LENVRTFIMSRVVVGVIGPGSGASAEALNSAFELGRLIALEGWVLLTGGRNAGVMDAASRGAKETNGLTIGILPNHDTSGMSGAVDIPIITGLGQARNNVNVLSSRILFACGMGPGTASEIALAFKAGKKVILLNCSEEGLKFFITLGQENVYIAAQAADAIEIARSLIVN
jgi:uncharacterized protein (TIGR00725 family)